MNIQILNPVIDAFREIMPQLGFSQISRGNIRIGSGSIESLGVTVIIGMTQQLRGGVAYNLSKIAAMNIASGMMGGIPVKEFNEIPQSAIAEMVNMVTANAACRFEKMGLEVNISPPSIITGREVKATMTQEKFLSVEMFVNENMIELNLCLQADKVT